MIIATLLSLWVAFRAVAKGRVVTRRISSRLLFMGACLIAGGFTLAVYTLFGQFEWHEWLAWFEEKQQVEKRLGRKL